MKKHVCSLFQGKPLIRGFRGLVIFVCYFLLFCCVVFVVLNCVHTEESINSYRTLTMEKRRVDSTELYNPTWKCILLWEVLWFSWTDKRSVNSPSLGYSGLAWRGSLLPEAPTHSVRPKFGRKKQLRCLRVELWEVGFWRLKRKKENGAAERSLLGRREWKEYSATGEMRERIGSHLGGGMISRERICFFRQVSLWWWSRPLFCLGSAMLSDSFGVKYLQWKVTHELHRVWWNEALELYFSDEKALAWF